MLSILCVSAAALPILKQNLMQIRCSFKSVILEGRKTGRTHKKNKDKANMYTQLRLADWFTKGTCNDT